MSSAKQTTYSVLPVGRRPSAKYHLNGASFQQDALVTCKGWQYAAFYLDASPGRRQVNLSRRKLPSGKWRTFSFSDYDQTHDDGHNTISIGISPCDGRIHIIWDLHSSQFNYRVSKGNLTAEPEDVFWATESFGDVKHELPGLEGSATLLSCSTYPRFITLPKEAGSAMLLELRTGIAGLGDARLFAYDQNAKCEPSWSDIGIYLAGVNSSPYINGIDCDPDGGLHVTYCYRDYVPCDSSEVSQHAGPNGPENNHDLHYIYSPLSSKGYPGVLWYDRHGKLVGDCSKGGVRPEESSTLVFAIPKNTGILNQEAQCIAPDGMHVLNRETIDGVATWIHYHIPRGAEPSRTSLSIKPGGSTSTRGKIVYRKGRLFCLLPTARDLSVLDLATSEQVLQIYDAGGLQAQEVLYDRYRSDMLSVFAGLKGELVVVDIAL